jgi:Tol biopolymer transport system component/DNA-binding winged helix-turn-helix (wHTH) protein
MEGTSKTKTASYFFDDVEIDCAGLRVQKGSSPRKITPRAFEVLVYLVEHRGRIVEKQELFDEVWKEKFVTDNALTRIIKEIRQVIGDDADAPQYIETIPKRGYRFIAEVNDVETTPQREKDSEMVARSEERPAVQGQEQASRPKVGLSASKAAIFGAIILALAAVAAVIIWKSQNKSSEPQAPSVLRNLQLTTWPGLDAFPSLSPDGNSVAYSSDHSGSFEIYVSSLTPGAREIQITSDGQQNFEPAWSPDGKLIAYYSKNRGGIWIVPASGGAAKQLTEFGSRPAWSPDGSRIAFQSYGLTDLGATSVGALPPSTLWIVGTRGGDPTPITQVGNPPGGHGAPSWSPDGKRVLFLAYDTLAAMWTVSAEGNDLKQITDRGVWAYDPIYSPDGEHIYYGGLSDSGSFVLYKLRVSSSTGAAAGKPVEVANTGLARIKNLTISADGKKIAYAAPTMMGRLDAVTLSLGSGEPAGAPVSLTQNTTYRKGLPSFSPDGSKIAYTDFRGGTNQDIWVMDADGKNQLQLTTNPAIDWGPTWFPDGDRIAFQSFREGKQLILSVFIKSGRESILVVPGQSIGWPKLSPDGKKIAFNSTKSGTINVWLVPVEGGEPKQLTFDSETMGWPCWSPDGKLIAIQMKRGEDTHVCVMPADGGVPMQLTFDRGQSWVNSWSPDGDKIAFAGQRNDIWNIYWVSRTTKEQKQLTLYSKLNVYVRYPSWSPQGNRIVYEYAETTGNIWLMELK